MTHAHSEQERVSMHSAASPAPPSQIWKSVLDYLDGVIAQTGFSDWCFGMSIAGNRYYYAKGAKRAQSSAALTEMTFELSCVVNPLYAAVASNLSERGLLDLEAPIATYISELADDEKAHKIRVRHLLNHTGGHKGFLEFSSFRDTNTFFDVVRKAPIVFSPGAVFSYEQSGPAILSHILYRTYGQSLVKMLNAEVITPLGLTPLTTPTTGEACRQSRFSFFKTGISRKETSPVEAIENTIPSRIRLGIGDVLTIVEALMGRRSTRMSSQAGLAPHIAERLRTQVIGIPRTAQSLASELLPTAYGTGIAIYQNGFFGYDGRAGQQVLGFRYNPECGIGIALGMNSGAPALRRIMLRSVIKRIGVSTAGPPRTMSSRFQLDEITGDYVGNHSLDVRISTSGDNVDLEARNSERVMFQSRGKVSRTGELEFGTQDPGGQPTFFRDPNGGSPCMMLGMCAFKRVA